LSWIGLRYKGVEPLFPDEWNKLIDALDILFQYVMKHEEKLAYIYPNPPQPQQQGQGVTIIIYGV